MITLSADIEGTKELSRRFIKIPENIQDSGDSFAKIGREVMLSVDANYATRGSLFGEPWPSRKTPKPWPLLEKTGRMRRSFNQRLGRNYVEISNPTEYFKFHQSNKPRKKLPRRVMLKLDEIRRRFIVRQFQLHIRASLKK